jgi:hypothetical protein
MLILVDSGALLRLMERADPQHGVIRQTVRTLTAQGDEFKAKCLSFLYHAAKGAAGPAGDMLRRRANATRGSILGSVWPTQAAFSCSVAA